MIVAAALCNQNPDMSEPIVRHAVNPYSSCNTALANSMNHPVGRVAVNTIAHTLGGIGIATLIFTEMPVGIGAAVGAVTGLVSSIAVQIFNKQLPAHLQNTNMATFLRVFICILLSVAVGAAAVALGAPLIVVTGAVLLGLMTNFMMRALATSAVAISCCAGLTANTANSMLNRLNY